MGRSAAPARACWPRQPQLKAAQSRPAPGRRAAGWDGRVFRGAVRRRCGASRSGPRASSAASELPASRTSLFKSNLELALSFLAGWKEDVEVTDLGRTSHADWTKRLRI